MEWILIAGMVLTGAGILIGLYLPVLSAQFATPERIRVYVIVGAALVVIGVACEVAAVWPIGDVEFTPLDGPDGQR
jgi:formate-dependent nitrite reductase membrane component NrfD